MKTGINIFVLVLCLLGFEQVAFAQCPQTARSGQHVIQAGETLYKLAKTYQVSLGDLCAWNKMTIYDTLRMCQVIQVQNPNLTTAPTTTTSSAPVSGSDSWIPATYSAQPTAQPTVQPTAQPQAAQVTSAVNSIGSAQRQQGGKHIVQSGETVAMLAELYGYTEKRFRQINVLTSTSEVTTGSVLISSDCTCPPLWTDGVNWSPEGGNTVVSKTPEATAPVTHATPSKSPTTTNPASSPASKPAPPATNTQTTGAAGMTQAELDMVAEINLLRSNPAAYAPFVEKYQRESMLPASSATAAELIAELKALPRLSNLETSACLRDAAKWHAEGQRPKGDIDHQGVDGSWPWDRALKYCPSMTDGNENIVGGPSSVRNSVIVLLLDEGIPNRGHRRNLLNKEWNYVACYGAGMVGTMPNCYVQMFGK